MPDFKLEQVWARRGFSPVAGLDEAGRGPWAGPVFAAAVVLDPAELPKSLRRSLNDSKKLAAPRRAEFHALLCDCALIGVGQSAVEEIDSLNILQATFLAMRRAVEALPQSPAALLIDGNRLPAGLCLPAEPVVKGDGLSLSIAAASVVAKVERDREMDRLAALYPGYGWESNRGYGTAEHLAALRERGPCPAHRRSFRPVRESLSLTI